MQPLYELSLIDELDVAIPCDLDTGEVIDAQVEWTQNEMLARDIDGRIDEFAAAIRTFEANAKACAEEEERFAVRKRILGNKARRAREWLQLAMVTAGRQKVGTALTTAWLQPNGGKAPVEIDEDQVPFEFIRHEPKVDVDAIRTALEQGEELPFARLTPRGSHLRLK